MILQRKTKVRHLSFGKDNLDQKSIEQDVSLVQLTHFTNEGTEDPARTIECVQLIAPFQ